MAAGVVAHGLRDAAHLRGVEKWQLGAPLIAHQVARALAVLRVAQQVPELVREHARGGGGLLLALGMLGCGDGSNSGPNASNDAVLTSSGLDKSRLLSSLTDQERTQFCTAATKTLFSATTPDRECELEGVVNAQAAGVSCEDIKSQCLIGFIEAENFKCTDQIKKATACTASVGDGEQCSLASGSLHASLLPDVTFASDAQTAKASIAKIYAAEVFASTAKCTRCLTCRMTF
jgi:hypothetical protein